MMTLEDFVRAFKAGTLTARQMAASDEVLATTAAPLPADTPVETLTAEAYNQDVLPADLPWDEGLAQVTAALEAAGEDTDESRDAEAEER